MVVGVGGGGQDGEIEKKIFAALINRAARDRKHVSRQSAVLIPDKILLSIIIPTLCSTRTPPPVRQHH